MRFRHKRLLFLGGAIFQVPGLLRAKRLGCHIILVDQSPDPPGRPYADEYEHVSALDSAGWNHDVLAIAVKHRIDAVMTYASDTPVPTVAHVAERLGLPGNPSHAADVFRRKDLWREFQEDCGLPHPAFFAAGTEREARAKITALRFPIVVKPADSSGTSGQSVIHGIGELPQAFESALAVSRMKRTVCEEFIHADLMELGGDVWFEDGRLRFRHYGHNYFLTNRISNVPSGERFPGSFNDEMSSNIDAQLCTAIDNLGLRSGNMNFDALTVGGRVFIVDIGLRCGGNYIPDLIQLSTSFDLSEAAVYSAFGEKYPCRELYCTSPAPVASYLMGSRFAGRFEGLDFHPKIQPYVVDTRLFVAIGSTIGAYTRADAATGITFFRFPDVNTMDTIMNQIEDLVKVRVESVAGNL